MRTIISCLIASFVLVGCATTPLPSSQAKPAPAGRVIAFQEMTKKTTSTIVVTRDEGVTGSGCFFGISLNGQLAARLGPAETARFSVEPGEYVLTAALDPWGAGLCSLGTKDGTKRETILRDGDVKHFRLFWSASGGFDVQRAD